MSKTHPDAYRALVGSSLIDETLEAVGLTSGNDFTVGHITRNLLNEMRESGINFRHLVGGAIYIAGFVIGQRRTQKELASVLEISESSVRNGQKAILEAVPIFKEAMEKQESMRLFTYWQWFEQEIKPKYGMES